MTRPCREDRLAYKTIGSETIILDTKLNQEVHQLNELASFIWNLCDGQHEVGDIISEVCEEFEVTEEIARTDVESFIVELQSKSLLFDKALWAQK